MKRLLLILFIGFTISGVSQTDYKKIYYSLPSTYETDEYNKYDKGIYDATKLILSKPYRTADENYIYAQKVINIWVKGTRKYFIPFGGAIAESCNNELEDIYVTSMINYILKEHFENNRNITPINSTTKYYLTDKKMEEILTKGGEIFLNYLQEHSKLDIDINFREAISYSKNGTLNEYIYNPEFSKKEINYKDFLNQINNTQSNFNQFDTDIYHTTFYLLSKSYSYTNEDYEYALQAMYTWLNKSNDYQVILAGNLTKNCNGDQKMYDMYVASMIQYCIKNKYTKNDSLVPQNINGKFVLNKEQKVEILTKGGKIFLDYITKYSNIELTDDFRVALRYDFRRDLDGYILSPTRPTLENVATSEDIPFAIIDEAPTYPGCEKEKTENAKKTCMNKYLQKHVARNFNVGLAKNLGLSPGKKKIYVQFKITTSGSVEILGIRAPHRTLEHEAGRVVNKLPKMTPGYIDDKPVNVIYMLPIAFNVD